MASHWEILKSGRIAVINTPEDLVNMAMEYFKWCDNNPILLAETVAVGKMAGQEVNKKKHRPYTVRGLCLHCGISMQYIDDISKMKSDESDYVFAVSRIAYIIHTQNIEMAMVGEFNPILVGKILNMDKDTGDVQTNIKITIERNTPELAKSENELLEKLDLEIEALRAEAVKSPTEQLEDLSDQVNGSHGAK